MNHPNPDAPAASPAGGEPPSPQVQQRIEYLFRHALQERRIHPLQHLIVRHRTAVAPAP